MVQRHLVNEFELTSNDDDDNDGVEYDRNECKFVVGP